MPYISGLGGTGAERASKTKLDLPPGADPACFICRGVAESADRENLILERTAHSVTILNRFPYNNGHLLVAPLAHKGRPHELSNPEQLDLQQLISQYVERIERLMHAEGFNIGLNLGRAAGAGVPGHLHWHIVPRWFGDTNFMTPVAAIQILPQALDALWEMFHEANAPGSGKPG
ncbi:MAG TPA: HIT domain-containing protein [Pirellulales bacterium]|jgi:ATP adenylyltransferase|nr:HIT domain-containing protein [Pirellulales bacterium]